MRSANREDQDAQRRAILPAAAFIVAETVLMGEAISMILAGAIGAGIPGGAAGAVLLSIVLLANFALLCGIAAWRAGVAVRRARHRRALQSADWSTVVQPWSVQPTGVSDDRVAAS